MSKDDEKTSASLANTRILATRFFQLALERQFAEAERILERLRAKRTKMGKNEWNRGYFQALNGIILTQKSGDERYAFFGNLSLDDEETLKKNRREFLNYIKDDLQADYDRGFFSAWADFLRTVLKAREKAKQAD